MGGFNLDFGGSGSSLLTGIVPFVNDGSSSIGSLVNPIGSSAPAPAVKAPSSSMFTMSNTALLTQIMGGVNSAVGGFFQAQSQQYQDKSQAVNLQYQSDMAAINARNSEYQAESDLRAGKSQIANYTMQEGQQASASAANTAARGLRAGVGTTRDVAASMTLVKDINVYNINSNAVREASAARVQATSYQNQSNLDSVSAANANRSASSISPFASVAASLLTSASSVASNWNNSQRMKQYLAQGGYMPMGQGGSF